MDISVIIPTYKPGDYIYQCLDSLSKQTLDKNRFEIIVILNGCDEPWYSQLSDFIAKNLQNCNIHLVYESTGGVSRARNIGLQKASGQYITFIDDDDYISQTFIVDLLSSADDNTVVLSNSISFIDGSNDFDDDYPQRRTYYDIAQKSKLTLYNSRRLFNGPCMKLIPKCILSDFKFDESLKNGEDSLYMFAISCNIKQIKCAPETAIYYRRIRSGSATTSGKRFTYKLNNTISLMRLYTRYFIENPCKYDFKFYISRILGGIKTLILN